MVKIPLQQTFKNPDGEFILRDESKPPEKDNITTTRDVLIVSLAIELEADQKVADLVQDKLARFNVYQKLLATTPETEEIFINDEDAARLKPRVAKCFGMLVSGPVLQMLNTLA